MAHTKSPKHMLGRQPTSHKVVACQISRLSDLSLLSVVAHSSADEFRGPRHPCDGDDNPFAEPWACEIQQTEFIRQKCFCSHLIDLVIERADLPHPTNHDFTLSPAASSVERPSDVERPYPMRGSNVSSPKYLLMMFATCF